MGPRFPQGLGSDQRHPPFGGAGAGCRGARGGLGKKIQAAGTAALPFGKGYESGDVGNVGWFSLVATKIPAVAEKVLDWREDFE